jgi:hypothetical protein
MLGDGILGNRRFVSVSLRCVAIPSKMRGFFPFAMLRVRMTSSWWHKLFQGTRVYGVTPRQT